MNKQDRIRRLRPTLESAGSSACVDISMDEYLGRVRTRLDIPWRVAARVQEIASAAGRECGAEVRNWYPGPFEGDSTLDKLEGHFKNEVEARQSTWTWRCEYGICLLEDDYWLVWSDYQISNHRRHDLKKVFEGNSAHLCDDLLGIKEFFSVRMAELARRSDMLISSIADISNQFRH